MSIYRKIFRRVLENGPGYVPSIPNTAGNGGALGNAPNMYASGLYAKDTSEFDFRSPSALGIYTRRGKLKKKKKINRKKK